MKTDLPALRVQLDRAREVQDTHEEARILGKMGAIMRENGKRAMTGGGETIIPISCRVI